MVVLKLILTVSIPTRKTVLPEVISGNISWFERLRPCDLFRAALFVLSRGALWLDRQGDER
jgi:hypothetical protein